MLIAAMPTVAPADVGRLGPAATALGRLGPRGGVLVIALRLYEDQPPR